jgi:hypothetical protein
MSERRFRYMDYPGDPLWRRAWNRIDYWWSDLMDYGWLGKALHPTRTCPTCECSWCGRPWRRETTCPGCGALL